MTRNDNFFRLPVFRSLYRSFAAILTAFFVLVCWLVVRFFGEWPLSDALAEYANSVALGIGALLTLVLAQQHPLRSHARLFWWIVALAFALVAANESFAIFERVERAWGDDDYIDLVVLCLTPIGLYAACLLESAPRIAVRAMQLGFIFQCLSDAIDLCDGDGPLFLYRVPILGQNLMNVLTDISELIFIETYLFGLGCLLLHAMLRKFDLIKVLA
jgi:ABC-type multidrug transport system fused ATPase/permease subunit